MKKWMWVPLAGLIGAGCFSQGYAGSKGANDLRAYMHGIDAVKGKNGDTLVFFSSSGLPPTGPDEQRNWTHDIYVSHWNGGRLKEPEIFIQNPEAQEPVSVAETPDGHIMLTMEDGWNAPETVSQRYGVYDSRLNGIAPYPMDVEPGGHSGHVAAVGNKFVVFYSDDWVDGGGVDNLGTGKGVYAKIYNSDGRLEREADVAPQVREWWPMVAGSPSHALLLWQQYIPGKQSANLKMAVLDPESGEVSATKTLVGGLKYYTYKVAYIPSVERFLITGSTLKGKGFAYLVDDEGSVTAKLSCMPATVREAGIAVSGDMAYTPSQDNRLLHLKLEPSSITLAAVQPSSISWSYTGNLGLMRDASRAHWVSLTREGLEETDFDLNEGSEPKASDRCGK